jgi:diguanylate cyclase (GGDEF)-like protein
VRQNIFLVFVAILSALVAILLYLIDSDSSSMFEESRAIIIDQQEKRQAASEMMRAVRERSLIMFSIYHEPDVFVRLDIAETLNKEAHRFSKNHDLLKQSRLTDAQRALFEEVVQIVIVTSPKVREAESLFLEESDEEATTLMIEEVLPSQNRIMNKLDAMLGLMDAEVQEQLSALEQFQDSTYLHIRQLVILFILVLLVSVSIYQFRARIRERVLKREVDRRTGELMRTRSRLKRLGEIDSLTELANRHLYAQALEEDIHLMKRADGCMSLVLINIDHFKAFNDHYGYDVGDVAIKGVAQVVRNIVTRKTDLAARFSGEEFVLLLPLTDAEGARRLGEKIRQQVEGLSIKHEFSITANVLTVSVGVACLQSVDLNKADLIRLAGVAIHRAKNRGRNQVCVYEAESGGKMPDEGMSLAR